jgi:macrolide transport system ATP-binding/permease protein
VVISYRAWQNYFASDPSVVGATFTINSSPFTVVGVTPPEFYRDRLTDTPPDFWMPLEAEPWLQANLAMLNRPNLRPTSSGWY